MCDIGIHNELIDMDESMCPYCDALLIQGNISVDSCCNNQNIENMDGMNICKSCGLVDSCTIGNEYIDFQVNLYKIKKKSIYNRFYYIENVLNRMCLNNQVELTNKQRAIVYKIFDLIDTVIPKVNENRKRLISINYILKMLFNMMELPYNVPISKSKKTVKYYKNYWNNVISLIGDDIQSIIDHKTGYKCYPISV